MDEAFEIIINQFLRNEWAIILVVIILILSVVVAVIWRKFFKSVGREYKEWKNDWRKK